MKSLVSIIIPVYNCELGLYEALKSVKNQTYENIEVIIINDGSTDNSLGVCEYFSSTDSRFKIFSQVNQGVAKARNMGLEKISGEYLMFVDADDKVEVGMIQAYLDEIEKTGADVVIGGITFSDINNQKWNVMPEKTGVCGCDIWKQIIRNETGLYGYIPNKMYRVKIIRDNKIRFNETMYAQEDFDFALSVYSVSNTFSQFDKSFYEYKYRPGKRKHPIHHYINNQLKMIKCVSGVNGLSCQDRQVLNDRIVNMMFGAFYAGDKEIVRELFDNLELKSYLRRYKSQSIEKKLIVYLYNNDRYFLITFYFKLRHLAKSILCREKND